MLFKLNHILIKVLTLTISSMKKSIKNIKVALLLCAPVLLSSCATIVAGGSPSITINGDVSEKVTITTEKETYPNVNLPAVVKVNRHHIDGQRIQITSDNYKFNDIILEKTVNEWTFGNILLGGLIGWGVDLGTNCVSKPAQKNFTIQPLPKQQNDAAKSKDESESEK